MIESIYEKGSSVKYDASVIVPVYNAENTLKRTISSLLGQSLKGITMEIILIDDGSTDSSAAICDKYSEEHTNIKVYHQENKGVSAARNNGIDHAQGKYIFFLDSDDEFSDKVVQKVVKFFDANADNVDLVSFPIAYVRPDGTSSYHWRYEKFLTKTGIYGLDSGDNIYISQTTMNICVKKCSKIRFDNNLKYGEDQLFITETLAAKNALGFVKECEYRYIQNSSGAGRESGLLLNSWDDVCLRINRFLQLKKSFPAISRYVDAMILYDFNWRIRSDSFLPYQFTGKDYEEALAYLGNVVSGMDSKVISQYPGMKVEFKYYLLSLMREDKIRVSFEKETISTFDNETGDKLFETEKVPVGIIQLKIRNDELYCLGYINCLELVFSDIIPILTIKIGGHEKNIPLFDSRYSCFATNMKTGRAFAFILHEKTSAFKELKFFVTINGISYPCHIAYSDRTGVNLTLHRDYIRGKKLTVLCLEDRISIRNKCEITPMAHRFLFNIYALFKQPKHWAIRNYLKLKKFNGEKIWLYFDSHDAIDNGFYQFQHDFSLNDGIRRYYVYPKDRKEILPEDAFQKYGDSLVPFGSRLHKTLLARAEKVFAAYIGRGSYIPYSRRGEQMYKDLLNYEVIYLQHGVMNAKLPNMYSKEKMYAIDKVVVSTDFEKENLEKLAYDEDDIITSGMARFDQFIRDTSEKLHRKILFAPSWRKQLVATQDRKQVPVNSFYKSPFFLSYYKFLHSDELRNLLDKEDIELDVQVHPMFSCYRDTFELDGNDRIHIVNFSKSSDYDCCITDFSSILFDYIYLDKPVISYFPDQKEFAAGIHTYKEFSFPIKDGFMISCDDGNEVVQAIRNLYANHMRLPENIQKKADHLFFDRTTTHAERLYQYIKDN